MLSRKSVKFGSEATAVATSREELKKRIREYLSRYPMAKDTIHGIATFWVGASAEVVADALAELVEEEVVEEVWYHGTSYYQRREP